MNDEQADDTLWVVKRPRWDGDYNPWSVQSVHKTKEEAELRSKSQYPVGVVERVMFGEEVWTPEVPRGW